jgi:hypothetical protein
VNGVVGTSALSELIGVEQEIRPEFETEIGKEISTFAFRNGRNEFDWLLRDRFLGGRNSEYQTSGDSVTAYGVNVTRTLGLPLDFSWTENIHQNREGSMRWDSFVQNSTPALTTFRCIQELLKSKNNNGWFNHFAHWHFIYPTLGDYRADYENFFSMLKTHLENSLIYQGGYGDVVEYHVLRDSIQNIIVTEETGHMRLSLTQAAPYTETDLTLIKQPISILLDLRNTSHAGKEYVPGTSVVGIRKVQTDVYVVDVTGLEGIIEEDVTGTYYTFAKPTQTPTYTGGVLTVTTNIPTRCVIYDAVTASINDAVNLNRDEILALTHYFTVDIGKNVFIGVISATGQSILSGLVDISTL